MDTTTYSSGATFPAAYSQKSQDSLGSGWDRRRWREHVQWGLKSLSPESWEWFLSSLILVQNTQEKKQSFGLVNRFFSEHSSVKWAVHTWRPPEDWWRDFIFSRLSSLSNVFFRRLYNDPGDTLQKAIMDSWPSRCDIATLTRLHHLQGNRPNKKMCGPQIIPFDQSTYSHFYSYYAV